MIRYSLTRFAVWFRDCYLRAEPPGRKFLWAIAELLFPWYTASILLGILWMLGVFLLGYDLRRSGLADAWGFGQILPTFLVENYAGTFSYSAKFRH
jgi:hypothetical protein